MKKQFIFIASLLLIVASDSVSAQSQTFTPGSVLFGGPNGSIAEDNLNFFWDNMIKRLNIQSDSDIPIMLKRNEADGLIDIFVGTNIFDGVHDDLFGWGYNRDGAATAQPIWSESFESRFVTGAPPEGLLERHFNYQSIDRTVAYRPWNFDVNLNTHDADVLWRVLQYSISSRTETNVYYFNTDDLARIIHHPKNRSEKGFLKPSEASKQPYPRLVTLPKAGCQIVLTLCQAV